MIRLLSQFHIKLIYYWTVRIQLLVFISCFNCGGVFGQNLDHQWQLTTISVDDGLSQNAIRDIVHDKDGFIWIATKNGLNRYDGYAFEHFLHNAYDSNSLSSNNIYALCVDQENNLWIGSQNGLDRLNIATGEIDKIPLTSCPNHNRANQIADIQMDSFGRLWIEHTKDGYDVSSEENGLSVIELELDSLIIRPLFCDSSRTIQNIHAIYIDETKVHVGTSNGLYEFDERSLMPRFVPTYVEPPVHLTKVDSTVIGITRDMDGNLWVANIYGLNKIDAETRKISHYYCQGFNQVPFYGNVNEIAYDSINQAIYLANSPGFVYFNIESEQFIYLEGETIPSNTSCIYGNSDGTWWFGTNGTGIFRYSPKGHRFEKVVYQPNVASRFSDFSIRAIFQDEFRNLWIGAQVLYKLDALSRRMISYEQEPGDTTSLGTTSIWSITEDDNGYLWIGTDEGAYQYHEGNDEIRFYSRNNKGQNGLPEKAVYWNYTDKEGNVWLLTDSYLCRMNASDKRIQSHLLYASPRKRANQFGRIHEDRQGRLWINTNHGLLRFNKKTKEKLWYNYSASNPDGINNDVIRSLCPDPERPDEIFWLGTAGGGLNRFHVPTGKVKHYTTQDGLPDMVVYGILTDERGYLWMSTNKGLSRFDRTNESFLNFSKEYGLQSNEFNSGAYYKAKDGKLYFGGIKGFNSFYPEDIEKSTFEPQVVITSFLIDDPKVNPELNRLTYQDLKVQDPIELAHNENIFTISFASFDFNDVDANQFQYRLVGWNKEFINSRNTNSVTFSNVAPGRYTFQVKGSNSDGVFGASIAQLNIYIKSPWWWTNWAKAIYALALFGAVYWLRSRENRRMRLKHELNLQLEKANRLRELDNLKSRFFSNISHEFRTPLTVILSPLDDLIRKTKDAEDQETLHLVQSNARRLLDLINQLLDLSKATEGRIVVNIQQQCLLPFLNGLVQNFQPLAKEKQISLELQSEVADDLVPYDRDLLEKVLSNLISNAIKFTSAGGHVMISASLTKRQERMALLFVVEDDGIGLSEESQKRIFDRYFQVSSNGHQDKIGTGIGLALTKELVELVNGTIEVQSELGKGSRFTLAIPISSGIDFMSQIESKEGANSQVQPAINGNDSEKGDVAHRVLVVDDNADIRKLIRKVMGEKCEVYEAENGQIGLEVAQNTIPDVVISDVMMPNMDGYTLCKSLKSMPATSHIPVIMLTAKTSRTSKISGLEYGADVYLTKPFDADELRLLVKNCIQRIRMLQLKYAEGESWDSLSTNLSMLDQAFVNQVDTYLEDMLQDADVSPDKIAASMALSGRQFRRKLKALTGFSPAQYIRKHRLRKAKQMLASHSTIAEVAYEVGFSTPNYFSKCFKDEYGLTAREYMEQKRK